MMFIFVLVDIIISIARYTLDKFIEVLYSFGYLIFSIFVFLFYWEGATRYNRNNIKIK